MISIIGIIFLLGLAVTVSTNRKAISLRTVLAAFALQFFFAGFTLYTDIGSRVLGGLASGVSSMITYSTAGIVFVFGPLGDPSNIGFIFLVHVLPVIIFMSALMSVLYHLHIMQWVAQIIGGFIAKVTAITKIEALGAASNIFVSQTEAPVVIRPYIKGLSDQQFFTLMVVGMSSVAGSVLVGYAAMGIPLNYLIAAAFMSAPGGILMAKIIMPTTDDQNAEDIDVLNIEIVDEDGKKASNLIEAAAEGATIGLKLVGNIGAMLLAFVALIALLNGLLGWVGSLVGADLSLELILGTVFSPLLYVMGVPWAETAVAGNLVGQKLILNEFVAFTSMLQKMNDMSPHTVAVVTFALCGFANFSSLAIQLGGLGALDPARKPFIAKIGMRALAAGTLANLMSATMASLILSFV